MLANAAVVEHPVIDEILQMLQGHILGNTHPVDHAGVSILGNPPDPGGHQRGRIGIGQVTAYDHYLPRRTCARTGQHLSQLRLSIARHAGQTHNFARMHVERNILEGRQTLIIQGRHIF